MTLNDIIGKQIDEALSATVDNLKAEVMTGTKAPNPRAPRIAPPQDIYDQDISVMSPVARFSPGRMRPLWNQPDVAVTHTPLASVLNSGQSQNTETNPIVGGVTGGVVAPASGFAAIPNMQSVIKVNGPVHLVASLSVQSNTATDTVSFAFYRGGSQISQIFTHTTPSTANKPTLVSFAMIDSGLAVHAPLNYESYALYWKAGTGALSTPGTQRSLYCINLVPQ